LEIFKVQGSRFVTVSIGRAFVADPSQWGIQNPKVLCVYKKEKIRKA
jgi:hypothetical protein